MVDGANTIALSHGNLNVAIVTPVVSPRVTHDPVGIRVVLGQIIADDGHIMISVDTALTGVKNATMVVLEDILACVNRHSSWLINNSTYHAWNVPRTNTDVGRENDTAARLGLGFMVFAIMVFRLVPVVFFEIGVVVH